MQRSIEAVPSPPFPAVPAYTDYVLDALQQWRQKGMRTALLTIVQIDGASPRPLGSQLAAAEDGAAIGAITGGCAEQTLVLDALAAIERGRDHFEIYGKGSRFKDIALPCGSGIGVHFDVTLSDMRLEQLIAARHRREASVYSCPSPKGLYKRTYEPQRRLVIFGHGHVVATLAQLGQAAEYETWVHSPVDWVRRDSAPFAQVYPLRSTVDWDSSLLDPYTAFISLFHDHDYETDLLHAALSSPAFYIGALGSRPAHQRRLETLAGRGWPPEALRRIHGPVGLDIGAVTPPEIAISIISQVIETARAT